MARRRRGGRGGRGRRASNFQVQNAIANYTASTPGQEGPLSGDALNPIEVEDFSNAIKDSTAALKDSTKGMEGFTKGLDQASKGAFGSFLGMTGVSSLVNKAEEDVSNYMDSVTPSHIQSLADSIGAGGLVRGIRDGFNNLEATPRAQNRLGGLAGSFIRQGIPVPDELLQILGPIYRQQERDAGTAQMRANQIITDLDDDERADAMRQMGADHLFDAWDYLKKSMQGGMNVR